MAAGSGYYLYNNTGTTSTATSTWTGNTTDHLYIAKDPIKYHDPVKLAQHRPLEAAPIVPRKALENMPADMADEIIDRHLAVQDIKVIEIPTHRLYAGMKHYKVQPNTLLTLPDGTMIDVEDEYNYKVHDARTQITREHCSIRAFNRFINASELLEAFIKDMVPVGLRQDQILKVPIEAFINWLIHRAAEADGDDIEPPYYNHRCGYCKRFIPRKLVTLGVNFCNANHLDGYLNKVRLLEAH